MSAGDPDLSFSGDGQNTIDLPGVSSESANAALVLDDGKILLAGRATVGSELDFFVARLLESGNLDPSFGGGDGFVTIDFAVNDEAQDMVLDSTGRIIVVGTSSTGSGSNARNFAVARLNGNGTLDGTFSGDGKTEVDFGINDDAMAVDFDPVNGHIYVGGYKDLGASGQFALVRLLGTGAQDSTYSTDGEVFFGFGSGGDSRCYDIKYIGGGRVVMVGYDEAVGSSTARNFAYAMVGSNALLDPSFSGDGLAVTDFSAGSDDEARSVEIDHLGRVVVGGFTDGTGGDDFAATRLTVAGSLDSSFNGDGRFSINLGGVEQADDVIVHPDGDITLSGLTTANGFQAALVRLGSNAGQLSTTFGDGGDGVQLTNFGALEDGFAVALDPRDLRVVVAGNDGGGRLAVARVHDLIDPNFSSSIPGEREILPDGKLLVRNLNVIRRLHPDGASDPSFGSAGAVTLPDSVDFYSGMAVDSQGRIVVVGSRDDVGWIVRRLLPDGSHDPEFSGDGVTTLDFSIGFVSPDDTAADVAIDAFDRPVVVGEAWGVLTSDFGVARYTTAGALDSTFDGDGKAMYNLSDIPAGAGGDQAESVLIQPDGKIVVVGKVQNGASNYDWGILRLDPNGSKDLGFATLGERTPNAGGDSDLATDVAIDASGRLFVVGSNIDEGESGSNIATIMCFNADGSFANSFAGDGVRDMTNLPLGTRFHSVLVQPDGKILAMGQNTGPAGTVPILYRFTASGGDDSTFASDGAYFLPRGQARFEEDIAVVNGAIYAGSDGAVRLNVAPAVGRFDFRFATGPQNIFYEFNDFVGGTLSNTVLTVRNITTNTTLLQSAHSTGAYDGLNNESITSFNAILADGNYTVTFSNTGITNNQNMQLSGDRVKEFFFLNGDANRDRIVNISDFAILAARFNLPGTFSQGNFNYAGNVDISDFAILASQFNKTLPAPADLPRPGGSALATSPAVASASLDDRPPADRVFSQLEI